MNKYKRYYLIRKDLFRRKIFYKLESFHLLYKFIKIIKNNLNENKFLYPVDKFNFFLQFNIPKSLNFSTIRNKCLLTGRNRSIYRDFRLSRMQLCHLASFGLLMGIKKSSW
jgi:ribosomal protein S14